MDTGHEFGELANVVRHLAGTKRPIHLVDVIARRELLGCWIDSRAHGASLRRAATTMPATVKINPSNTGFVVRLAAVASPSAHTHHAMG